MTNDRKWRIIGELCQLIAEDSTLENCAKDLECITYAPNIGYRSWIFSYKGIHASLWDMGNGHYAFHSWVGHWDIEAAKRAVLAEG